MPHESQDHWRVRNEQHSRPFIDQIRVLLDHLQHEHLSQIHQLAANNQQLQLRLNQNHERLDQNEKTLLQQSEALDHAQKSLHHEFHQHGITENANKDLKQRLTKAEESATGLNETAKRLANIIDSTAFQEDRSPPGQHICSDPSDTVSEVVEKAERIAELEDILAKQEEDHKALLEEEKTHFQEIHRAEQDKDVTFAHEHFPDFDAVINNKDDEDTHVDKKRQYSLVSEKGSREGENKARKRRRRGN